MTKFKKTLIAASLLAMTSPLYAASNATDVSPAERAKIEEVVHQYLLRKPEVIVEVLQILQKRQYEEAEKTVKTTQASAGSFAKNLFHDAKDPIAGNANGSVTITEFFDYQCPHCIDMVPIMDAIVKANPNVRVVYKEFPIRGPLSDMAARAALAANKQGKYNEFSHALLTANQPYTEEFIIDTAKKTGLDVDKLKKDMDSAAIKNQLNANVDLGKKLKLFGTPAFFIGSTTSDAKDLTYVPGHMDQKQLQDAIDKYKK